jgi:sucrose-6-phosphate hydrolase SacC (GH32 family)
VRLPYLATYRCVVRSLVMLAMERSAGPVSSEVQWLDYGRDNYAGVTFSGIPARDGRALYLGWMSNWQYARRVPTTGWRSAMTLPRSIHIIQQMSGGYRVASRPVEELQKLRMRPTLNLGSGGTGPHSLRSLPNAQRFEIVLSFRWSPKSRGGLLLNNSMGETYRVGFENGFLFSDRTRSGLHLARCDRGIDAEVDCFGSHVSREAYTATEVVELHLFVDETSMEMFVDGGVRTLTELIHPVSLGRMVATHTVRPLCLRRSLFERSTLCSSRVADITIHSGRPVRRECSGRRHRILPGQGLAASSSAKCMSSSAASAD